MDKLYEDDVVTWAEKQAALLRAGRWSELDIDNIAEEIEDVANRERQALRSALIVLLKHLLKWRYQPKRRGPSWRNSVRIQRVHIEDALEDHPSLRPLLEDPKWLITAYRRAVRDAAAETHVKGMPAELPWTIPEVLSHDFWPE